MTCVAFFAARSFLVSARICAAVFAWTSRKPSWTWTPDGTPGKSFVSGSESGNFRSVRSDSLHRLVSTLVAGAANEAVYAQLNGVGALVHDHDGLLGRQEADKDCGREGGQH